LRPGVTQLNRIRDRMGQAARANLGCPRKGVNFFPPKTFGDAQRGAKDEISLATMSMKYPPPTNGLVRMSKEIVPTYRTIPEIGRSGEAGSRNTQPVSDPASARGFPISTFFAAMCYVDFAIADIRAVSEPSQCRLPRWPVESGISLHQVGGWRRRRPPCTGPVARFFAAPRGTVP
jgi:hypothetical protein